LRTRGFTLLEVLVATVIATFVAVTAVGTLRAVTRSREKVEANLAALGEVRFAGAMIRKDLHSLYRDTNQKNVKLVGLVTETEKNMTSVLTFLSVTRAKARPGRAEGDVFEVEYFLQQKEEQSLLMRRMDPYPYEREEKGGLICVVAEQIKSFQARFYDPDEGEWATEWPEDAGRLPRMVEVKLVASDPEGRNFVTDTFIVSFPRWPQQAQQTPEREGT